MDKPIIEIPDTDAPNELVLDDLEVGTGPEAKPGQQVAVHYVGVAWSDGTEFDNSYDRGEPLVFGLGAGQVIQGWDSGIAGMKVGGRRRITIPSRSSSSTSSRRPAQYASCSRASARARSVSPTRRSREGRLLMAPSCPP